jgi:hypothetical protein
MRYGLTGSTAVAASNQMARFSSVNGNSYTAGGANEVRIRIKANGFLDVKEHFLQFTITGAGNTGFIDTHAGSFFDRITIEANGSIVEQINSYGLYNSIRKNYNRSLDEVVKENCQAGSPLLAVNQSVGAFADVAGSTDAEIVTSVNAQKDAFILATNQLVLDTALGSLGDNVDVGDKKVYQIQLESGLFKNHHHKALPDGLTELELVLRLAGNKQVFVAANGQSPSYTMSEVSFNAPVYMIQDAGIMSEYRGVVSSEGVMISGDTAKTYINSVPNGSGVKTLQINDRSLSCKALVTAIRLAGADNTIELYSNGAYGYTFDDNTTELDSYKYVIGGVNYPTQDIKINLSDANKNLGRVQEETCRALALHGETYCNSLVSQTMLTKKVDGTFATITDANPTNKSLTAPRGLVCIDLKKFSDDGLRMVGMNTSQNSSPNVLELNITTAFGHDADCTTFSIVEAFYQMDGNGGLSVVM